MNITLVDDWKAILKKAWSVKFNALAALFGGLEVVVAIIEPQGIPNGLFAGIAGTISILSNVMRVLAQKELGNADK